MLEPGERAVWFSSSRVLRSLLSNTNPQDTLEDVRTGYVFLAAYYFLLDAVVDGHLKDRLDAVYLSELLSGAYTLFSNACYRSAPRYLLNLNTTISQYLAANSQALLDEDGLHRASIQPDQRHGVYSIIGRSNAVLLLYAILCLISGRPMNDRVVALVKKLTYYIQLTDDLGDWRDDYRAGRYTSLLRECFARHRIILSEPELESDLILGGVFEERSAIIINGLDSLIADIAAFDCAMDFLKSYIIRQRQRVAHMTERLEIKIAGSSELDV